VQPRVILDPCAGGNRVPVQWEYKPGLVFTVPPTRMPYPTVMRKFFPRAEIITSDIREDSPAGCRADFLDTDVTDAKEVDLVITNPPFAVAQEFVEQALKVSRGYVVMLLRLNFLGSAKRLELFQRRMPERIYVHHKRMSFTPDGKADSTEYMHAVWHVRTWGNSAVMRVI